MRDAIKSLIQLEFHDDSVHDLRGRQSVRTTFKLTERSIHALSILAGQLGIRQKSLFDYLIDDIQALRLIAEKVKQLEAGEQRVAKTYVISRKTLENLEQISTSCNTPRDVLVEFSIERILPLIRREKEKHVRRKQFLAEIEAYLRQGGEMLRRAEADLGAGRSGLPADAFHAAGRRQQPCRYRGLRRAGQEDGKFPEQRGGIRPGSGKPGREKSV
jgi:hypothetical protein